MCCIVVVLLWCVYFCVCVRACVRVCVGVFVSVPFAIRVLDPTSSRITHCEQEEFREEAGVVAAWAGRKRSPVHDPRSESPEPAACSGALFCLFPNTLTSSVSGSASKLASQRFAAPFSIVSQYVSAKRVRKRCEARFPALAARRKASPKR